MFDTKTMNLLVFENIEYKENLIFFNQVIIENF